MWLSVLTFFGVVCLIGCSKKLLVKNIMELLYCIIYLQYIMGNNQFEFLMELSVNLDEIISRIFMELSIGFFYMTISWNFL